MSDAMAPGMATMPQSTAPKSALPMVLVAQFFSAMADNALLFAAIALLKTQSYAAWSIPLLQEFFVAAYIILAPFAGPLADRLPKSRVMLAANGLKLLGALAMLSGLNPFIAYAMVGLGAAAYSPAKYGILGELVTPDKLVKANGAMESSTIAAILLGALGGGQLADWSVTGTLGIVAGLYAVAGLANLFVPAQKPSAITALAYQGSLGQQVRNFGRAVRTLWNDPKSKLSICATSAFWGAGATLRFLLVAWVPVALGITSNAMPAYLNASTAVGIVIGAALAGRFITIANAHKALWAGIGVGLAVAALAFTSHLTVAFILTGLIGAFGGFFVVPLNALLQERGHALVGTGSAIAVQNLFENVAMLALLGSYSGLQHLGMAPGTSALIFGGIFGVFCLALVTRQKQ